MTRADDQFPDASTGQWVEVSGNLAGGLTVTVYEADLPVPGMPRRYTVATAAMGMDDARALAARILEHADAASTTPCAQGGEE